MAACGAARLSPKSCGSPCAWGVGVADTHVSSWRSGKGVNVLSPSQAHDRPRRETPRSEQNYRPRREK
eukprot:2810560-Amphidinium_carterae.1